MNYAQYLKSPEWSAVTKAVVARDGGRCRLCNGAEMLQAHHRTYANLGNEMEHLDDLTCLCRMCHFAFHHTNVPGVAKRGALAKRTKSRDGKVKLTVDLMKDLKRLRLRDLASLILALPLYGGCTRGWAGKWVTKEKHDALMEAVAAADAG